MSNAFKNGSIVSRTSITLIPHRYHNNNNKVAVYIGDKCVLQGHSRVWFLPSFTILSQSFSGRGPMTWRVLFSSAFLSVCNGAEWTFWIGQVFTSEGHWFSFIHCVIISPTQSYHELYGVLQESITLSARELTHMTSSEVNYIRYFMIVMKYGYQNDTSLIVNEI